MHESMNKWVSECIIQIELFPLDQELQTKMTLKGADR